MPTYLNTGWDMAYMPAWPILLYSGQAQPWSTNTKLTTFLMFSSLLTLPGVIPLTLVPEAVEVPQSLLRGLGRLNIPYHLFSDIPAFDYMLAIKLYAGPSCICRLLFLL
jgi:hypothetical protein